MSSRDNRADRCIALLGLYQLRRLSRCFLNLSCLADVVACEVASRLYVRVRTYLVSLMGREGSERSLTVSAGLEANVS
jgi:hypothetical protein